MSDLRMPDLNLVVLAGRLTRDPEVRYLNSGTAVCDLRLASTRYFRGRDGERREENLFVDVTVWDKTAEYCGEKLRKGRPILVEGRLKSDSWEDKTSGQKRTKINIHANRVQQLDWDESRGGGSGYGGGASQRDARPDSRHNDEPIPEDDIPF